MRPRLAPLGRNTALLRHGPSLPQMQSSTSMGREPQIRIEPWANPSNLTYVLSLHTPEFFPSLERLCLPGRDLEPFPQTPRLESVIPGTGRDLPCDKLHLRQWERCALPRLRRRARYPFRMESSKV